MDVDTIMESPRGGVSQYGTPPMSFGGEARIIQTGRNPMLPRSINPENSTFLNSMETNSFLTNDSVYYTPNELHMDPAMGTTIGTINTTNNSDVSSLAWNLHSESFAMTGTNRVAPRLTTTNRMNSETSSAGGTQRKKEQAVDHMWNQSKLPTDSSLNWSAIDEDIRNNSQRIYHTLEPPETSANATGMSDMSTMSARENTTSASANGTCTSTNVLKIVRMCPECHMSVDDLLVHYEQNHGCWNEEDKRDYLARERQRIEKSEISDDDLREKLRTVNCTSDLVLAVIRDLLLQYGIRTYNVQKKERFSSAHPFVSTWKNWLIEKKRFNANNNEEFETVCKMLMFVFGDDTPSWCLLVKRKSRIAQFVRSRHLSNKPADMTAAAMKSLQTLRNFAIISMGSKTNDDEDSLPEEQYRDFMGFLDEESYKFRRILNKQKMEKPAAKDAKKRAEMLRAVNPTLAEVGNGNNTTTTTDVVLSDGEPCSDKVSEADWRQGYHFTEKWKKFALSRLNFECGRRWTCDDVRLLDALIPDEIIARGDLTELKRVRQTVFQVAKGLWQRFQISQILLDYKGDFRNSEAAKDFYLKEVARRRWPTANLARSLNGVLAQFRNGHRPKRAKPSSSSSAVLRPEEASKVSIEETNELETTVTATIKKKRTPEKRGSAWNLSSSSDEDDLFDDTDFVRSPTFMMESQEQSIRTRSQRLRNSSSSNVTDASKQRREHVTTARTAALFRERPSFQTTSTSTSNDSDYLRFTTVCERYETMDTVNEDEENNPRCSTMREDCIDGVLQDLDVSSIPAEYTRTSTPIPRALQ